MKLTESSSYTNQLLQNAYDTITIQIPTLGAFPLPDVSKGAPVGPFEHDEVLRSPFECSNEAYQVFVAELADLMKGRCLALPCRLDVISWFQIGGQAL